MKKNLQIALALLLGFQLFGQDSDSTSSIELNSADKLLLSSNNLLIGGYGEVHYNQPFDSQYKTNGKLDVHRLVMLLGYTFNTKTQFISEIEFEHVKEVYVEQAFLQHKISNAINLRAGLMLIPMGIINEYHEPTSFFSVERPDIDNKIAPTTWREIGAGISGSLSQLTIKYQAYIVNGFNGFDESGKLKGSNGFRSGRQKGAESYISSPNFAGKIEYYGLKGLNIGLSAYTGKSQSAAYNGIHKDSTDLIKAADSTTVGLSMLGLDLRYSIKGAILRGQLYYSSINNTKAYNKYTGKDLGSAMLGYYLEAGYNVGRFLKGFESELTPFARFEYCNTHFKTEKIDKNPEFETNSATVGINWKPNKYTVFKAELQLKNSKAPESSTAKAFNAGIGFMF